MNNDWANRENLFITNLLNFIMKTKLIIFSQHIKKVKCLNFILLQN